MKILLIILIVIFILLATVGIAKADTPPPLLIVQEEKNWTKYLLHPAGDCHAANATGEWPLNADPWCSVPSDGSYAKPDKNEDRTQITAPPVATGTPDPKPSDTPPAKPTDKPTPKPPKESDKVCTDVNSQGHTQCSGTHSNPNSGHEQNTNKPKNKP